MEPAARGLSNEALVQYHLARVYEALERPSDAAKYYLLAMELLGERENEAMSDVAERLATVQAAASSEN